MTVNEVSIVGFRNYTESSTARFSDGVNIITGQNGQGKTNLLEVIYYLSTGRSFRAASDRELISFDSERAHICVNINSAGRDQTLEAKLDRTRRRELYANGVKLKKSSDLGGRLSVVLFTPDDLNMIKSGASVRRKLLDHSLSQLRPGYLSALTEYNRLHDHKTRILRDYHDKPSLLELLDDFNQRMAEQSARLIYYRSGFSELLSQKARDNHAEFSGGAEELNIRYKTVGGMDPTGKKPSEILPELLEHQRTHYQAELRSGLCLSGAHKDDLEVEINGASARKFASQGQARTASVSIKLAERDIHIDDRGEEPVLLLDDVLSELDVRRQDFILSRILRGQVIITCCDDQQVSRTAAGAVLRVEDGVVL